LKYLNELNKLDDIGLKSFRGSVGPISGNEFLLFKNYIMEKSGIVVPPEKSYLIETRLARLMAEAGADSFSEFYYYNL